MELKLDQRALQPLRDNPGSSSICLKKMLRLWLTRVDPLPTISALSNALRQPMIRYPVAASNVDRYMNGKPQNLRLPSAAPSLPVDIPSLSLREIIAFPGKRGNVNILQEIGINFLKVGVLLLNDHNGARVKAIEHKNGYNSELACLDVFQLWMQGSGRQPVSWQTLVEVFTEAGLMTLAGIIEDAKTTKRTMSLALQGAVAEQALTGTCSDYKEESALECSSEGTDRMNGAAAEDSECIVADDLESTFLACCELGKLEDVQQLARLEVDINTANKNGFTGLMLASEQGHVEVVRWLLPWVVDVQAKNKECSTALDLANSKDHWPVVELLVIAGAKLDTPEEAAAETVDYQVKSSPAIQVPEAEENTTTYVSKEQDTKDETESKESDGSLVQKQDIKMPFLQWEECDTLPTTMGAGFAVCIGDFVYTGGGVCFVQHPIPMLTFDAECSVFKYDCRNNKWDTLPIVDIHKFGMAKYKERLVLIGGASRRKRPWDTLEYSKQLTVWDETTHNWISPYPEMKTARMQPTSVGYGNAVVVAGGKNSGYLSDVEVMYDSGDDKFEWTQVSPLPASISRATSALSGGTWYLMGGLKQSTAVYYTHLDSLIQEALSEADQRDDTDAPSGWKTIPDTKHMSSMLQLLY